MSKPMKPIRLTPENDILREYPTEAFSQHTTDKKKLSTCIGVHDICSGWVDFRKTSPTHSALTCRCCGLRVAVPNNVETYGDLRRFCEKLEPRR